MATAAFTARDFDPSARSGGPLARFADRWIFVAMAGLFVFVVLLGFVPDSVEQVQAIRAGERPPYLPIAHVHAALMGSFMLLLFAQTWLAATGSIGLHRRLGVGAALLVPALVLVGFALALATYQSVAAAAAHATGPAHDRLLGVVARKDNILLLQTRIGVLFPLFLGLGARARVREAGLHKRMMLLGTAVALTPAINRMAWLPMIHAGPVAGDLYVLLTVAPLLAWDAIRNRTVHRATRLWLAINAPFALVLYAAWDTPWWHALAPRLAGG